MDEPKCKGAIFKANAAYIRKIVGEEGFQTVTAKVAKKWPGFDVDKMAGLQYIYIYTSFYIRERFIYPIS